MITGEISSNLSSGQQCFLNDIKNFVKNGYLKSRNLSEEKKTTPITNIPLLSYRKSEQKQKEIFSRQYFTAISFQI